MLSAWFMLQMATIPDEPGNSICPWIGPREIYRKAYFGPATTEASCRFPPAPRTTLQFVPSGSLRYSNIEMTFPYKEMFLAGKKCFKKNRDFPLPRLDHWRVEKPKKFHWCPSEYTIFWGGSSSSWGYPKMPKVSKFPWENPQNETRWWWLGGIHGYQETIIYGNNNPLHSILCIFLGYRESPMTSLLLHPHSN